jgi:hypothetical protein
MNNSIKMKANRSMNSNFDLRNLDGLKTLLRNKYPQLTEADLSSSEGNENDMLRMIEYKLGKTKRQLRKIITDL